MHFSWSLVALLPLLSCVHTAPHAATPNAVSLVTNAQRLAAGLPPLRPTKFERTPGRTWIRDKPTKVSRGERPSASATSMTYSGRIEVRNSEGSSNGFMSNEPTGVRGVNLGAAGNELHVRISTTSSSDAAPFDILTTNPNFPAPYYIGGTTNGSVVLATGSSNSIAINTVQQTPSRSPPMSSLSSAGTESAIWAINRDTKELTAQWVNPDGSTPHTLLAYDIRENTLFLVGDLDAYNAGNSFSASEVRFFVTDV